MWKVELARAMQDPSSSFCVYLESVSNLSQSRCPVLSFGTKHKRIQQEHLLHTPVHRRQPDLISRTTNCQKVTFGDRLHSLFKGTGAKGGVTWELMRGWGILAHSSPPGWAYLQPISFKERISPVSIWSRYGLTFYRETGFGLVTRMR